MKISIQFAFVLAFFLHQGVPLITYCQGAPDNAKRTSAYQSSVAQEQLRGQTKRVQDEMSALLQEFKENKTAVAEVAQAQQALEKLGSLSDTEMLAVVKSLREASRSGDTGSNLVSASTAQKNIQAVLRSMADRLTTQKDEASIRQRLRALAIRQTTTQRQTQLMSQKWFEPSVVTVSIAEQEALKNEVQSAMETLQKLSTSTLSSAKVFAAAFASGNGARITESVTSAASETAAKNFAGAVPEQGRVVSALQLMIDQINASLTKEERLREMVAKMKEMASNQRQLASITSKSYVGSQASITKNQQLLSTELTVIEQEIARLNPQAGTQTETTLQAMKELDSSLTNNPVLIDKIEAKTKVVQSQANSAELLSAIGDLLQQQARELANANNSNNSSGAGSEDPSLTEIQKATKKIMDAKTQIGLANANMHFNGATQLSNGQLENARSALAEAQADANQAGGAVPQQVGENLNGAQADAAAAQEKGKGDRQQGIDAGKEALTKADQALAGLQAAAGALMAAKGGMLPAGHGSIPGKGTGAGMLNGGTGQPNNGGALLTDVSATSGISPEEREAMSLLQREKAPPQYAEMSRQYLKNLADGELPGE
ncbi:MAG: hypothetical protein WCH43_01570 [Verrucomicrobiota bacterium]